MLSVDEVLRVIGQQVPEPVEVERVGVTQAFGRVLGEGVEMGCDSPPFDRSMLDGFAVRSGDASAGAMLRIVGRQDAGVAVFEGVVGHGECVAINTGGVFPKGADGVLMVEHSRVVGGVEAEGQRAEVLRSVAAGAGVQRRGADAVKGAVVLKSGMKVGAAQVAVAASAGAAEVVVRRRVRVAILTTGDELVTAGSAIAGGQIRNSNGPMLGALVNEALGECGEVLDLGVCGDVEGELMRVLGKALAEADVVIVTGGMSMGTRDLVPAVLEKLGVEFHVEKVRMKPGKPFVFGSIERKGEVGGGRGYVAGLPGNPVSAFVTFQVFVREVLERLAGLAGGARWMVAEAGGEFGANGEREFFQPCALERRGAVLVARPLGWKGSGDIFTVAGAEGLARRAVGAEAVAAGGVVEVLRL